MIRIPLMGRTGNNLFQYALGRVLAGRHGVPLVLDGSWFDAARWREVSYFLSLPLRARVVRRWPWAARGLRTLTGKHYWEFRGVPVLKEDPVDHSFDERLLRPPADCVLMGYFQTPRYFESIGDELRAELNGLLAAAVTTKARENWAELTRPSSVAVHVRRTDYLAHRIHVRRDGDRERRACRGLICDLGYYERAMDRIRGRIPGARFFIFSDDPAWCRTAFRAADQMVMDSGPMGNNPLHDLHAMSRASHHIIANSSYSWWAAWLGAKTGQQVITPDRWFGEGDILAPLEEKWPRSAGVEWSSVDQPERQSDRVRGE